MVAPRGCGLIQCTDCWNVNSIKQGMVSPCAPKPELGLSIIQVTAANYFII